MSKRLLHAGCGGEPLPAYFQGYDEVRLDADADKKPDIVASITALPAIGAFDVVYCCHVLEHLNFYDVDVALKEFFKALMPGGKVVVVCPDIEGIEPTEETVYIAEVGPICGLDMLYGHRGLARKNSYMEHRTGFTSKTLKSALERAGFADVVSDRHRKDFNIMAGGTRPDL